MSDYAIGIYLGQIDCSIATRRNGTTEIITNDDCDRITPFIVSFTEIDIFVENMLNI